MLGAAVKTAQSVGQSLRVMLICSSVYIEMEQHLDYQSMRLSSGGRSGGRSSYAHSVCLQRNELIIDVRPTTGIMFRKVRVDKEWTDDRPCATSKRTSDTRYPEGDPMFVADSDGCEYSSIVMDDKLTIQSTEQRYAP
jgi:hypothetical protein